MKKKSYCHTNPKITDNMHDLHLYKFHAKLK